MSDMHPDEDRTAGGQETPWSVDAGPEPEWAEAIRRGRKARGDRLREVFAAFDDDLAPEASLPRVPREEGS
ncbi:MAG TPA: hypothetical protein VIX39_06280 [Actinomycetota bacterium]